MIESAIVYHGTAILAELIKVNNGTKITSWTEIQLSNNAFPTVPHFVSESLIYYIGIFDPKAHAEIKAGVALAKYIQSRSAILVKELAEYHAEKYNGFDKVIFDRISDLSAHDTQDDANAVKIKQAATCAVLAGNIADFKGCFSGLIYKRVSTLEQIQAEYSFCKDAARVAYDAFLQSEGEFYTKADVMVCEIQAAEIQAMQAYFKNMADITITDHLHRFLKRYRLLSRTNYF